ncbi:hypothetical protein BD626DRAFT_564651 [Schizophyllum amplum]|uniref:Uncharacterized protein n=1 Tax=Schizophyllum amplum TaxID=97359 RepID=A0A550CSH2_9AGAR|nr:hypothetical protein BD626DRAFT_564651 [Auriculariopsis ampla]
MSFPSGGSYFTFRLDPIASLEDIDDEQVAAAARRLLSREYVACVTNTIGVPHMPPALNVAVIDLVQRGMPTNAPDNHFEARMCVPIRPNTQHPEGRRVVHCCHPLPWNDCYHNALHRTRVRIRSDIRDLDPPHSLSPNERVALRQVLNDDVQRRELLRACTEAGIEAPPARPSKNTIAAIELADEELTDVPYWERRAAEQARLLAGPADEDFDSESGSSDQSETSEETVSEVSAATRADALGPAVADSEGVVAQQQTAPGEQADNIVDLENLILSALTHRADLDEFSPVIEPLSYDISVFHSPPSPSGFMEEIGMIKGIRRDYERRIHRLKKEVQRRDEEYISSVQGRQNDAIGSTEEPQGLIAGGRLPIGDIFPGDVPSPESGSRPASHKCKGKLSARFKPLVKTLKTRLLHLRRRLMSPLSSPVSKATPRKLRVLKASSAWRRWKS